MSGPGADVPLRVALAAGEPSGDLLGAGLVRALKDHCPDAQFEGIAGPRMVDAGCASVYPMERLSVMGFVEVAGRYLSLMRDRRALVRYWLSNPPDVFVGIDAPDFNLGLERRLRDGGIPTVHYVSPSVWAWRRYRIRGIRRAVSRMLTLFPFEADFYREVDVDVRHVGHPLADDIPLRTDAGACRTALGLPRDGRIVALLPGSRRSEVSALSSVMLEAAGWIADRLPGTRFVIPAATPAIHAELVARLAMRVDGPPVDLIHGQARTAMGAADAVILASGTATLEAMLVKRPMVVTYRVHPLTYRIMKALFTVSHVSLPNLLAGRGIVPECLQDDCRPEVLGQALVEWFEQPERIESTVAIFDQLHESLRGDASERAARAVLDLVGR